jgi:hypothetical protein
MRPMDAALGCAEQTYRIHSFVAGFARTFPSVGFDREGLGVGARRAQAGS